MGLVLALALLAIVAILGRVAILRWRRRLLQDADSTQAVWSLADLERLRSAGQITEQEFRVLRRQALGGFAGPAGESGAADQPRRPM